MYRRRVTSTSTRRRRGWPPRAEKAAPSSARSFRVRITSFDYHAVTRGDCWASVADEAPIHLTAGDIIVFPHGDTHTLSSAPDQRSAPDMARFRPPDDGQLPFVVTMGASDAGAAHLVCGFLGGETRPFNPLLATLPRVIRVGGG